MICRASWYGDYGDPTTFLDMFESTNGNNDSGYVDPAYDQMLVAAETTVDPQERLKRLAEVEHFLMNEALPLLPIYFDVNVCAFDPDRITGLHWTSRTMTMMHTIEVIR